MESAFRRNNLFCIFLLLLGLLAGFLFDPYLPASMPIHFDIHGNADGYAPKELALIALPGIALLMMLIESAIVSKSRNGMSAANLKILGIVNIVYVTLILALHFALIMEGMYPNGQIFTKTLIPGMALLFMFFGNYLGKTEPNGILGIRLPWTLKSEENWKKTHRFVGLMYVLGGFGILALTLLRMPFEYSIGILLLMTLLTFVYPYWYYVRHEKKD